jgi:sugar lactone lactonase YvrE
MADGVAVQLPARLRVLLIAGTGAFGFSGDGGPATAATVSLPQDVAVDSAGNLYITDWDNLRIRGVDGSGTIQTFAGSGFFGYNGNRLPALRTNIFPIGLAISPSGVIYFSDSNSYRVREIQR